MNDVYQGISAKNCSKDERRPSETRVPFQSLAFFHNIKNKKHLFRSFLTYLCPDEFCKPSPLAIVVYNENETFKI